MTTHEDQELQEGSFVRMCAEAGIKATQQRREIYHEIFQAHDHPDAAMLYRRLKQRLPALSLDTVYRNLHILESAGILRRVAATGPRARYEVERVRHHHFVCNQCGKIYDFSADGLDAITMPAEALQHGRAQSLQIAVHGICNLCLDNNS